MEAFEKVLDASALKTHKLEVLTSATSMGFLISCVRRSVILSAKERKGSGAE